jgi:hypothetical protein
MLWEQVNYSDGGASFPQPTFQVAFSILHPADISKLPDKKSDWITLVPWINVRNIIKLGYVLE